MHDIYKLIFFEEAKMVYNIKPKCLSQHKMYKEKTTKSQSHKQYLQEQETRKNK